MVQFWNWFDFFSWRHIIEKLECLTWNKHHKYFLQHKLFCQPNLPTFFQSSYEFSCANQTTFIQKLANYSWRSISHRVKNLLVQNFCFILWWIKIFLPRIEKMMIDETLPMLIFFIKIWAIRLSRTFLIHCSDTVLLTNYYMKNYKGMAHGVWAYTSSRLIAKIHYSMHAMMQLSH